MCWLCTPAHFAYVVDGLQQPCDEGVCQLGFVVLEKCLEIITPWVEVEDDLAPAFLVRELSLICSDKMKASAAEFFSWSSSTSLPISSRLKCEKM
ncbi:hypothetical protein N9U05_00315 [bacterium]|nr:hypothetical protein [bacterium]